MARRTHRKRRSADTLQQLPWQRVRNPYPPMEIMSKEHVETIIESALDILEQHGMRYLHESSRRLLIEAGAEEAGEGVLRLDRGLVREKLATAPAEFTLRARNPEHDLLIGGDHMVFGSVGGPAFVSDLDKGRRPGTMEDLRDYMKLVQNLNIVHQESGGCFEPMDLPPESRHLDLYLAQMTLLDKNCQAYPLGRERTRDCLAMNAIALGSDLEGLAEAPAVLGIINTNSPRQLDNPMSEAVLELSSHNQAVCATPFTLAGSMSPAVMAGTLAQQTAEVLAVVTLAQTVRPGAPVMYGSFASNVDMQSGAPALGTPEYTRMTIASGQIARALGLPLRSSNTTTSNCVDAQAAWESQMSLWACLLGHANLVIHAAGWLESGLTASFEKLIVDAEMLQMLSETLQPIRFSEGQLAMDAIASVQPGGHHFGTAHTMERYESAFYQPMLSSRLNFEAWAEAGGEDAAQRANAIWKSLLKQYEPPPLEQGRREALEDYVARRKIEIEEKSQ